MNSLSLVRIPTHSVRRRAMAHWSIHLMGLMIIPACSEPGCYPNEYLDGKVCRDRSARHDGGESAPGVGGEQEDRGATRDSGTTRDGGGAPTSGDQDSSVDSGSSDEPESEPPAFRDASATQAVDSGGQPLARDGGGGLATGKDAGAIAEEPKCPAPLTCSTNTTSTIGKILLQLSMGFPYCMDETGLAPACTTNQDCVNAGLSKPTCLDTQIVGKFCLQICN